MGVKGLYRKLAFEVHGSWIPASTGMTEAMQRSSASVCNVDTPLPLGYPEPTGAHPRSIPQFVQKERVMKLLQFDELTYPYVPEIGWETRFSNRFCDPQLVHQTYMEHMEQWACSEEQGFDGIMTNEHHFTAFNIQPAVTSPPLPSPC